MGTHALGTCHSVKTWCIGNISPLLCILTALGYIFSGSAVVDINNTSGFGKDGKVPLVAIFTHHDPKAEKDGSNDLSKSKYRL